MKYLTSVQVIGILLVIFVVLNAARWFYNERKNPEKTYGNAIAESVEAGD